MNGDCAIDSSDARMVLQAEVWLVHLTKEQRTAADVIGDGTIDSTVARLILQYEVGLIDKFPVEELELGIKKYKVRDLNKMPEGQEITLNHVENMGYVTGWEPSEAVIVTSLDELVEYNIDITPALVQKYDATFFEDNAVIFMAMPVGNMNVNHQIDKLVRVENDLCLGTTLLWTGGLDVTTRVTWRFAFEVDKTDVEGVEKITRYAFDEKEDGQKSQQVSPPSYNNYADNRVIISLKRSYSTVFTPEGDLSPEDFPGLGVILVKDIAPGVSQSNRERIAKGESEWQKTLSLVFETENKEHVLWAMSVLLEMDIVFHVQTSIIYQPRLY